MPRNEGRKGRPLGPYHKGPRHGSAHLCYLTAEQQEDDRISEALSRLADSPSPPAWMDEPLPLGEVGQVIMDLRGALAGPCPKCSQEPSP
jgi:hypothetical protein